MTAKRSFRYLVVVLLCVAAVPGQASGAASPEALAMQFVTAYRAVDVSAMLKLQFVAGQTAAEALHREQRRWQAIVQRYRMTGYRVADLSGADHDWLAGPKMSSVHGDLSSKPLKKLVVELVARSGAEQVVAVEYIGAKDGRYYLIVPGIR